MDDLLSKLIVKAPEKRINWDYYFIHPFNTQQIIEIYVNIETDNANCKIIGNNFKIEQLTNTTFYVDDINEDFKTNINLNKGKHKIIILFNEI